MALSLSTTKTQLPPQANAAAEPEPGLAGIDAGTSPLFADALRQLTLTLDEPVPHDASMPAEPSVTEPAQVTDGVDEVDEATVGIETALQGMIPPLIPLMLPIAYRTALQTQLPPESPAPVTAVTAQSASTVTAQSASTVEMQAAAHIEGIPLPAAGLISLQQASATGRGTEFSPAPPVLQDEIAGEQVIDATRTSLVVQAVRSASAQPVENPIAIAVKEHVASAATVSAVADPTMATVAAAAAAPVETAPAAILKLPAGAPQQWRQPLADALGDRIQTQVGMRSESAVIRLDPPMMGQIEIRIHHEAGALQVQLSASHGEVVRQLNEIREHLRQDLVHRQYTDVSVLVSGNTPDGRQRQRQPEAEHDAPGRALSEPGQEADTFALLSDRD